MKPTVLVVDDEAGVRSALSGVLRDEGYAVDSVDSGEACLDRVSRAPYDVIVLDIWLPGIDGLATLARLRERRVDAPIVMISGHGNIESAVRAIKMGAFDFGENGTGKELVARSIHTLSRRRTGPFVEVNSAAIPEELIESELFGHFKGAFTGAVADRRGKFEAADGGTLFLDEIGDMSVKTQAKVLRVLEEQAFERVGGRETLRVDVRVIAASNRDLPMLIAQGAFREDLFYRLNVIPIDVP